MKRRTLQYLKAFALAAALGLGLSGPAAAADKIKLGLPAKMFLNLPEFVAQERGLYKENGLDVEFMHIADSSIPVRALISGDLTISAAGMSETLAAIDKGGRLRTIGGVNNGLHYGFWVNKDAGVKDVTDLPGKQVGISSPGSLPHVVLVALMRQAGMDASEIAKVKWVSMKGSAARVNGVIAGTIDATVAGYDAKAAKASTVEMPFIVSQKMPDYVMTPWDVSEATLKDKRDVLKRFVKAELLATRWIFENKQAALAIAAKHFDYAPDELDQFYAFYTDGGVWHPDGMITTEQAGYMQELNVEGKMQREVLPADRVLDTSIVEEVLDEIGLYKRP